MCVWGVCPCVFWGCVGVWGAEGGGSVTFYWILTILRNLIKMSGNEQHGYVWEVGIGENEFK